MNTSSSSPFPPVFSDAESGRFYQPMSKHRKFLRKSVPYVVTFVLGAGAGAAESSNDSAPASQLAAAPAPTVVYSPTPVPTVVYSPSPVPTVIYSPSPVPATESPAAPPAAAPAAPGAEQGSGVSEGDAGPGASPGAGEAPVQPESDSGGAYYRNCNAARDAGAAPLYRGQPGYRPELDRDRDGIACEWK